MNRSSNSNVTLKQIAANLGLGITTVSDILLRGKTNYRTSTIELVKSTSVEMGYSPNRLAQGMRHGKTSTIGILLTSNLIDPFFAELLNGLEKQLDKRGMVVILSISEDDLEKDQKALRFFESHRVDGLLIGPVYKRGGVLSRFDYYESSIPTVMMLADHDAPYDNVGIESGVDSILGRMVTNHLLDMGHSRIGYFMCPPLVREDAGSQPYRGMARVLRPKGLFDVEWIWQVLGPHV